ncbi:unnamed protein product, partial [Prorocentrum cordatum]
MPTLPAGSALGRGANAEPLEVLRWQRLGPFERLPRRGGGRRAPRAPSGLLLQSFFAGAGCGPGERTQRQIHRGRLGEVRAGASGWRWTPSPPWRARGGARGGAAGGGPGAGSRKSRGAPSCCVQLAV